MSNLAKKKKARSTKKVNYVKKFSDQVLKKYGPYVKSIVMMGSVAREESKKTSDIDIFLIVDDTGGKVTPAIRERMDRDLEKIGEKISKAISVQPIYTLTEFWDYARVGHPIIYNFIKEGVPVHDTGFFEPMKNLLNMGRIPSTREAIESYMEGAPKKIMRAKTVKLLMLAEDAYYAMLNTAQAVLMFMGVEPPVPNKAYDEVKKYLVEPGILEPQYAEWLRDIVEIRKKIEHKEMNDASGAFVDEWLDKAEKFIEKMFSLLNALEMRKKEKIVERTRDVYMKAAATAIKTLHKMPEETDDQKLVSEIGMPVPQAFKKEFIDKKKVDPYYWGVWNRLDEISKITDSKEIDKITDKEVNDLRESVRRMIHDLSKILKK